MRIVLHYFLFLIVLVSLSLSVQAQETGVLLFSEDFTGYTAGNLVGQGGWAKGGSGAAETVVDNTSPITFAGYNYGSGEYMSFPTNNGTSSRVYRDFSDSIKLTTPGSVVYASLLLNLNTTYTTANQYFFSLGQAPATTNYYAKLFAKQVTATTYNLGISKSSNTANFSTKELNAGETYVVVIRYDAHNTALSQSNNLCYMWINPVGEGEPDTTTADAKVWAGQNDYTTSNCSAVMWHCRGTSTPLGLLDGIRVAGSPSSSADAWDALNPGPMPVELSSFTYSFVNGKIVLNWRTATELNNRGFEVERKAVNDRSWTTMAFISGAGTSTHPRNYSYTDNSITNGKFEYRLKQIDNDGAAKYIGVLTAEMNTPNTFSLSQNYPNPFNPSTKINYQLPFDSKVKIELYNITGQKISDLVDTDQSAGFYSITVNANEFKGISSGIYLYKMTAIDKATGSSFVNTRKMTLMK